MYGLVNRSMKEYITLHFGDGVWEKVKETAGIETDTYISNRGYDDQETYAIVGALSQHVGLTPTEILEEFGVHWILHTGRKGYSELFEAGGENLQEFLENLPNFHTRISFILPKLSPPKFRVLEKGPGYIRLYYNSHRDGLQPFVVGLLRGLGEMYNTTLTIQHTLKRADGAKHDEFTIQW